MIATRAEALQAPAYFGGTFDPPHLGHREAVLGLRENPGLQEIILLPSGTPPFKAHATPAPHRVRMLELLFEGLPPLRIDRREIARAQARPGTPTTTFETLEELRQERGRSVSLIIGTDQLADLPRWSRFPELLGLAHWWVLERQADASPWRETLQRMQSQGILKPVSDRAWSTPSGTRLELIPTRARPFTSTRIREEIARSALPPKEAIPPKLWEYIKNQGLYGLVAKC